VSGRRSPWNGRRVWRPDYGRAYEASPAHGFRRPDPCSPRGVNRGRAQTAGRTYRVGLLNTRSPVFSPDSDELDRAFLQGLHELGYVLGQNLSIEVRTVEREPDGPGALVTSKVDLIFAPSTPSAQAARKATNTIPIVFCTAADPVGDGLVASFARPGGNATGLSTSASELSAKRLELTREVVPKVDRIAVLTHPDYAQAKRALAATEAAARVLGVQTLSVAAREAADFSDAMTEVTRGGASALIVLPHPTFFRERRRLADLALMHRLPLISEYRDYAAAGGLIGYGPSLIDLFRRAAAYVDRILKGAKPADLPVEQPTKFELVINLKTAKALGLTIPPSVLARADEVMHP
jgi:putative tryptophan/tyrosine transport system substrate-binding protein